MILKALFVALQLYPPCFHIGRRQLRFNEYLSGLALKGMPPLMKYVPVLPPIPPGFVEKQMEIYLENNKIMRNPCDT